MKVFCTTDGCVTKVVHDDGSETAIKTSSSVLGRVDDRGIDETVINRMKYSIIVSNSIGCRMSCQFCHLTMKGAAYLPLSFDSTVENVKEAMREVARVDPSISQRYVKLCWMGMGDDAISHPEEMRRATLEILDWLLTEKLALGVDGVDLGTVLPRTSSDWMAQFAALDADLDRYPSNPNVAGRDNGRSRFRIFYSLHSAVQTTRNSLIPGAAPLDRALPLLSQYSDGNRHNVALHYMLWTGVNDSEAEITALERVITEHGLTGHELRLLRYNSCGISRLEESPRFEEVARRMSKLVRVKVQASPGNEVKAACGQFIIKHFDPTAEAPMRALIEIAQASAERIQNRA